MDKRIIRKLFRQTDTARPALDGKALKEHCLTQDTCDKCVYFDTVTCTVEYDGNYWAPEEYPDEVLDKPVVIKHSSEHQEGGRDNV